MFISRKYRSPWTFIGLLVAEFPVTVAILALFGIAAPNLYRTLLWQDGADNGFNSNPNEILYAYANYKPINIPMVWGSLSVYRPYFNQVTQLILILLLSITNFNVVISVLSMFILLCKTVMYIVHVFPPLLSLIIHAILVALYIVSIRYQAGSDMSDPKHPQPGAPWYITKPCSVAAHQNDVEYCKQAKSAFACTCIMTLVYLHSCNLCKCRDEFILTFVTINSSIFLFHMILAIVSLIPTKSQREGRRQSRHSNSNSEESPVEEMALKSPLRFQPPPTPGTTGGIKSPMTPRTLAFNRLGGTKDLPLRNHFSSPQPPKSPTLPTSSSRPAGFVNNGTAEQPQIFFPPPPKVASKR